MRYITLSLILVIYTLIFSCWTSIWSYKLPYLSFRTTFWSFPPTWTLLKIKTVLMYNCSFKNVNMYEAKTRVAYTIHMYELGNKNIRHRFETTPPHLNYVMLHCVPHARLLTVNYNVIWLYSRWFLWHHCWRWLPWPLAQVHPFRWISDLMNS